MRLSQAELYHCGYADDLALSVIKWWESSRSFNPDTGLLPLLDLERSLWSQYWPWYCPAPLIVPHISGSMHQPAPSAGPEQYTWRVSLDVSHFSPSEISLSVKDGFLQIGGRHEERPDEHGFVARCFTRKYRLPAEIDVAKIVSWLSADGILTVEAPVPAPSDPVTVIIPIKVEVEDQPEIDATSDERETETLYPEASKTIEIEVEVHKESSARGEEQREEEIAEESSENITEESKPESTEELESPIREEEEQGEEKREEESSVREEEQGEKREEESTVGGEEHGEEKREEESSENITEESKPESTEGLESPEDVQDKESEEEISPSQEEIAACKGCDISQKIL
uniref:SHSP domain-containing protein n=1 Tax=Periophthalmus magnuspinnatus TaxID=409849 RepID=A0A3B3ZZC1_9GOBI